MAVLSLAGWVPESIYCFLVLALFLLTIFILFAPYKLINNICIALNNFHHFRTYQFFLIIWNRNTIVSIFSHINCCCHCLQQTLFINTSQNKSCFVQRFRSFCTCSDTYCRKRMSNRSKEAAVSYTHLDVYKRQVVISI